MSELLETMRRRRVSAFIADAHFLAMQKDAEEAVERERRRAMLLAALGEITLSERDAIFRALEKRR
jgi:hypothetical protein